jgi:hypothetical protein
VTSRRLAYFLAAVPALLHFAVCVYVHAAQVEAGWERLIIADFPFSMFVLVPLCFRTDQPLLWFGSLGSLWWYFLGLLGIRAFLAQGARGTHHAE